MIPNNIVLFITVTFKCYLLAFATLLKFMVVKGPQIVENAI
jgi:hypothetical protein